MVSCWFPMVSAWFPCCVIHEFHGFLVVSIWFPLVFTTNAPAGFSQIPKLAHGGRLGSLIGCFGSVFEPSSRCQPGRQLLGALISGPNKSSSGLRFGPNGNKKPKKGVRVGAIRMRSGCDPGAIQWVLERSGPREVGFCERSCQTTYPLYNINRKPLP